MKTECWCAHPTERWAASLGLACVHPAWRGVAAWSERPRRGEGGPRGTGNKETFFFFFWCGRRSEFDAVSLLLLACHYSGGQRYGGRAGGAVYARAWGRGYRF